MQNPATMGTVGLAADGKTLRPSSESKPWHRWRESRLMDWSLCDMSRRSRTGSIGQTSGSQAGSPIGRRLAGITEVGLDCHLSVPGALTRLASISGDCCSPPRTHPRVAGHHSSSLMWAHPTLVSIYHDLLLSPHLLDPLPLTTQRSSSSSLGQVHCSYSAASFASSPPKLCRFLQVRAFPNVMGVIDSGILMRSNKSCLPY